MNELEVDGLKFRCETQLEAWRAQTLRTKEEGTIKWLEETLRSGDVFWDVGANIGVYSLFAARLVGETGHVYAFEPHVGNAASLLRNVEANNFRDRVSVLTVALSDSTGFQSFNYQSKIPGSSGSQLGHTTGEAGEFNAAAVEMKWAMRGDELLASLQHPSAIKIDVDGNEYAVLCGLDNALETVRSVQVEVHEKTHALIRRGFEFRDFLLAERHHTAAGKQRIAEGADELSVPHNAVFTRAEVAAC